MNKRMHFGREARASFQQYLEHWQMFPHASRCLMWIRLLRSIGQGLLVVTFTLYLNALGWSGIAIGALLTASGITSSAMSLAMGILSDKWGRKPFLLSYEFLLLICALTALLTTSMFLLATVSILATFGRGVNGSAGPFSGVEQAWMTKGVPAYLRGPLFSLSNAVGFLGMGIGALLAGSVHVFSYWLEAPDAYRTIFVWVLLPSMMNLWLIAKLEPPPVSAQPDPEQPSSLEQSKQENAAIAKFALITSIEGLAMGLIGPLMAYWFLVKFDAGPSMIGGTLAISFFLTAIFSIATGSLTAKRGVVQSLVSLKMVGVFTMILLPFMPTFWLASLVYIMQMAIHRGVMGLNQAVSTTLTRDSRRGFTGSLNQVARRLPASAGPVLTGFFLGVGSFTAPFILSACFQLAYIYSYQKAFSNYDAKFKRPRQG